MPAASAETSAMLRQEGSPTRGEGQQSNPHRWPCRRWLRPAKYPLDVAQVRFHACPQDLPQPLVHS
ncbi:MAG: hypothetical protein ABR615_07405, partial [Pseudonocardiaceae bacterium]